MQSVNLRTFLVKHTADIIDSVGSMLDLSTAAGAAGADCTFGCGRKGSMCDGLGGFVHHVHIENRRTYCNTVIVTVFVHYVRTS
jgi:hypothetical protein